MVYKLENISLFSKLNEKQLATLQSELIIHHYEEESILFYEGDQSEYLHILMEGTVRLYKTTPKGSRIHIHHFDAPEIIALFIAFEDMPFPASCEFSTQGTIGLLPLTKIHENMHDINFSMALVAALARRMRFLTEEIHKATVYSSEAKIADIFIKNPSLFEHFKNNEIASILNITPETLSRILTKLKKENIIQIKSHVVTILNPNALNQIIETNKICK